MLLKAMKKFKLHPSECAMIGDQKVIIYLQKRPKFILSIKKLCFRYSDK